MKLYDNVYHLQKFARQSCYHGEQYDLAGSGQIGVRKSFVRIRKPNKNVPSIDRSTYAGQFAHLQITLFLACEHCSLFTSPKSKSPVTLLILRFES